MRSDCGGQIACATHMAADAVPTAAAMRLAPRSRQQSPHHAFATSSQMESALSEAIGEACKVPEAMTKISATNAQVLAIIVAVSGAFSSW